MSASTPSHAEALRARAEQSFLRAVSGAALEAPEAEALMQGMVDGRLSDLRIAALLAALEARGPAPSELAGFAAALSARMIPVPGVPEGAMDTCGTGGSGLATLNTSTLAGIVAAAAGATVAKHGNRSASGRCGSLDVLEALGAIVELPPETTGALLARYRFTFVNARAHHPALARLAPIRKALGFRTVFNLLGPMLSPAGVRRQLLGVSDHRMAPVIAEALSRLGHERAWVVAGPGRLDEIALTDSSAIFEVEGDRVRSFAIEPRALGLEPAPFSALEGGSIEENARRFMALLSGEDRGPARDHVALNAAAALVVAGVVKDLASGLERAFDRLESGAVLALFDAWREATRAEAASLGRGAEAPSLGQGADAPVALPGAPANAARATPSTPPPDRPVRPLSAEGSLLSSPTTAPPSEEKVP